MAESDRHKWNAIYRAKPTGGDAADRPTHAEFLERVAVHLPRSGRALDVAGGAGRNAGWLAARGLSVTVVDISNVALELAEQRLRASNSQVLTIELDLESNFEATWPRLVANGRWDVVLDFHYLNRPLISVLPHLLSAGGVFVFAQPTIRNLERHARPSERFLLREGEVLSLIPDELEILHHAERWSREGRHEAEIVARLPHLA